MDNNITKICIQVKKSEFGKGKLYMSFSYTSSLKDFYLDMGMHEEISDIKFREEMQILKSLDRGSKGSYTFEEDTPGKIPRAERNKNLS